VLTLAYDNKLRGYDSRTGMMTIQLVGLCKLHAVDP
jgi:hypothetical protein